MKITLPSLFVCLLSLLVSGPSNSYAQVNVSDSMALVELYNTTGGDSWTNHTNWLKKKPVHTWFGVKVIDNRVRWLLLEGNNVSGTLPVSLGNLDSLEELNFSNNGLGGLLPATLGRLTNLVTLSLENNRFEGIIPGEFSNLTKLTGFNVSNNRLSGAFPQEVLSMKALFTLGLAYNQFSGTVPEQLSGLNKLHFLYLDHNELSGSVPDVFAGMSELQQVYLGSNHFTGRFPGSVRYLPVLYVLNIDHNQMSGSLPAWLGEMPAIYGLDVSYNNLTGEIPVSVKEFPLQYAFIVFNFSHNQLTQRKNTKLSKRNVFWNADISFNRFTFNGLETLDKSFGAVGVLSYAPQAPLTISQYGGKLSVSAGGSVTNNAYTWCKVGTGESITIKGDSTFQPRESGLYYARVMNRIADQLVLLTDTVSYTASVQKSLTVQATPNPAKGFITISGLPENSREKITISDMSGFVWITTMSRQLSAVSSPASGQLAGRLDISRLKPGSYLISVSDAGEKRTGLFVKE